MVKRKKTYIKKINQLDTLSVHAGVKTYPLTGAVMTPIYATSTYAHDRPGEHKGYEYSRSQNPTREVLENSIAELEEAFKRAKKSKKTYVISIHTDGYQWLEGSAYWESPTLGIPTTEENKKSLKEHLEGKKKQRKGV